MPAKVLFLGVCAANRDLLIEWAEAGILPNYQKAMRGGMTGLIDSMPGFYVGTTWPSFVTSVSPARHGRHYIVQLEPGSYALRRDPKGGKIARPPFWRHLSDAGRKIALFDIPHSMPLDDFNGIQVVEWGAHDGDFARMLCEPPALAHEIETLFGPHPAPRSCDGKKTAEEYAAFRDRLVSGAGLRAKLTTHFLKQSDWDLFAQVWTESHCAGHQLWHLHDPSHPLHDVEARAAIGDPIRDVYVAIDAAIGRVLESVGADTTVILFTGHGMAAKYDAQFLLDDILIRLGHASPPEEALSREVGARTRRHRRLDDFLTAGWQAIPAPLKKLVQPLRRSLRQAVVESRPDRVPKIDRAASACFTVPNNSAHGGIRINLAGREPNGSISRGAAFDGLCARIAADLMEIVNLDTGEPIVDRVFRTDSVYTGEKLDLLPDLLVEWNQTSPVYRVGSGKIGELAGEDHYTRTGDHRKGGLFVARGPGIRPGRLEGAVDITDFGPTIAALLDVELPEGDGTPIPDVAAPRTDAPVPA